MATQLKIKQSSQASKQPLASQLAQGELALNTTDKKLYSKDSSGTIFEIGSGGGGAGNLNAANTQVQEFTGTATATFAVTGGYGGSDTITVYNNGVRLHSSDINISSGTNVVLSPAVGIDDVITIVKVGIQSVYGGSEIQTYEYTVTASTQTDFNATYDANKSDVEVYVNGIKLLADDFVSTTGTKIVLDIAAVTGDDVVVRVIRVMTLTANNQTDWNETDATVHGYLKNKPVVGDGGLTEKNFTTALNTKLGSIASGSEVNVQTDWQQTDTTKDDYLNNKPFTTIGSGLSVTGGALIASAHLQLNNSLTSTSTALALTAAQGKILNDTKAALAHTHAHSALTGIVAKEHLDWTTDQGSNDIHTLNIPIASASAIGGIKVGANLTITNGVLAGVNSYTLPTASATVLGGIKVGNNLTISNGVLSGVNSYTLPIATSTILGGFKVGANLTINSSTGVLAGAAPYTHPTAAGDKHVPSGGATNQVLKYGGSSGVAVWGTDAGGVVHFNQGTTPSSANLGDTWYDTSDGTIYKYINDGSQDTWVDISTAGGGGDPFPTQTNKAGQYLKTNGTDVAWNDLLSSPAFTGTPTAPTAGSTTNTTQLATTAFVGTAITNLIDGAPGTLDTLDELAAALNDDANHIAAMTTLINARLALAGGALTGALTSNSNITITGSGKYYGDGSALSGISTDNFYATSVGFSQTTGVLTIGRNGSLADLTVDLDGRYDQHYNQATAPSGTTLGDGWYDTDDGTFYKRVNDGTTDVWVDISTAGAGGAAPDWTEILNNPVPTFVAADANKYLGVNAAGNALEYQQDNVTPQGMYEHSNIISADYTIGNNMNAISAGPITINAGVDITIPVTSNWVVV